MNSRRALNGTQKGTTAYLNQNLGFFLLLFLWSLCRRDVSCLFPLCLANSRYVASLQHPGGSVEETPEDIQGRAPRVPDTLTAMHALASTYQTQGTVQASKDARRFNRTKVAILYSF